MQKKKTLLIVPFFLAALALIGCGAPDVEIEYVSDYEADGTYDKELDIEGPAGDYAEAYGLSETEMLELIELKLASGPGGADFEIDEEYDTEEVTARVDHDLEAESSKGEIDYEMEIELDGDVEYELEAELESGTMQQVLTEARRRRLAKVAPTVTIVNVANPGDFAREEATMRQGKDISDTLLLVTIDPRLSELCALDSKAAFFRFDSAELTEQAEQKLSDLSTCLQSGPAAGENIVLVGMADPRGTDQYNVSLGANRAESVYDFLQQRGVNTNRMDTRSVGERFAHEEQPSYWPYDRRVEIRLAD